MTIEVRVPQLPESVADATLVAWHKKPGDSVTRDENLVALEAGTSAAIIHAHYLALMTTAEARAISALSWVPRCT